MTVLSFLQASKCICQFLGYLSSAFKNYLLGKQVSKKKKKEKKELSKQYDILKLLNVVCNIFFKRNIKDPQEKSLGVHTGT